MAVKTWRTRTRKIITEASDHYLFAIQGNKTVLKISRYLYYVVMIFYILYRTKMGRSGQP